MRTTPKAASAASPAEVTITVTAFKDVLANGASRDGRGTDYVMKMGKRHPRVFIKGDDIIVAPPAVVIRFTIASASGASEKYYPVGITFLRDGLGGMSDGQKLGLLNFPQSQIHPDGRSLSITDSYRDDTRCVRYKFSVIIQRARDGMIGIIDPGIVHEGDQ
jgi:hypothetical protein